jgi:predicted RNA binding protein YcfA (HicA-like mRNA interferase family)
MSRLPQVTARTMLAALGRAGFVAVHSGDLPTRDVQDILKQTRISREEFLKLL